MNRHVAFFFTGWCLLSWNTSLMAGVKSPVQEAAALASQDDQAYDMVERAGYVVWPDEFKMEAKVLREKNGQAVFGKNHIFFIAAEDGHEVRAGEDYTIYRDKGHVRGGEDRHDLGILFQGVGVAHVLYSDSETILARVEKQYDGVRAGDGLRLQDTEKKAYAASKNKKADTEVSKAAPVNGSIAHVAHGHSIAGTGDIVHLDLGQASGLVPGERLSVYREALKMADSPGVVGKLGEVEILSVRKETSAALVVKSQLGLAVGDKILPAD